MSDFTSLRNSFSADDEGAQQLTEQQFQKLNREDAESLIRAVKNAVTRSLLQEIYDKVHPVQGGTVSEEKISKLIEERTVTEDKISKLIDEHIEKRMKSTPGKHNAVFPLFKNRDLCGTCFAFDTCRVLTARHNLFMPTELAVLNSTDTVQIMCGTDLVDMQIEATQNPTSGTALPDTDDWIVLRRVDNVPFRMTIIVMPTDDAVIIDSRPFVTIYHYPKDLQATISVPHTVLSSQNRLIGAHDGKLNCNDLSNISGGSCGGPYVDHISGGAYGFHIEGVNSYGGAGYKLLVEAMSLVPVALHFRSDSTLVAELKRMKVLF